MLSMRDCLDYCDITDDEVALIAPASKASRTCGCAGRLRTGTNPKGVLLLSRYMSDLVDRAERTGQHDKAVRARAVIARFIADHPTTH